MADKNYYKTWICELINKIDNQDALRYIYKILIEIARDEGVAVDD